MCRYHTEIIVHFRPKFSTVYSQYVLHLSSKRRQITRTPFLYGTASNFGNFNWKGNFGHFWPN